ncbi:hypothetical protein [Salinispora mooreana]|uniref:hypothetical protein n=2 Tax=Salinispora mooreana TaxID=999545 RepID=UPI0013A5BAC8|nr:hypothetical protein [Salinispora mooreana]
MTRVKFRRAVLAATAVAMSVAVGGVSPASAGPKDAAGPTSEAVSIAKGPEVVSPQLVPSGKLPQVQGPTYGFTEGASSSGSMGTLGVSLPFNYWFEVSYGLESRRFNTTTNKACTWLKVYVQSGTPHVDTLGVKLYRVQSGTDPVMGDAVNWPTDNRTYQYCWTGLSNSYEYYFWFGYGSAGNFAYARGDGSAVGNI